MARNEPREQSQGGMDPFEKIQRQLRQAYRGSKPLGSIPKGKIPFCGVGVR